MLVSNYGNYRDPFLDYAAEKQSNTCLIEMLIYNLLITGGHIRFLTCHLHMLHYGKFHLNNYLRI